MPGIGTVGIGVTGIGAVLITGTVHIGMIRSGMIRSGILMHIGATLGTEDIGVSDITGTHIIRAIIIIITRDTDPSIGMTGKSSIRTEMSITTQGVRATDTALHLPGVRLSPVQD